MTQKTEKSQKTHDSLNLDLMKLEHTEELLKTCLKPHPKPTSKKLIVNPKAELKIRIAMKHAKDFEIMWFGEIVINKKGSYILKDVHFPPQINRKTLVETDDEKFPRWFFERFTKKNKHRDIRLQGHTHPYFGTRPSGIDLKHAVTFLEDAGDYFIQMILSNNNEPTCRLYTNEGYQPVSIIWNYTLKIKKILLEVMHIESNKT